MECEIICRNYEILESGARNEEGRERSDGRLNRGDYEVGGGDFELQDKCIVGIKLGIE